MAQDFLGFGLLRPFSRDRKSDFASGSGAELVKSAVGQTLGTRASSGYTQGELPWRPEFGSLLHMIRHQRNKVAQRELAKVYVIDALQLWNPRVIVTDVTVTQGILEGEVDPQSRTMMMRVRFNLISENVPSNFVFPKDLEVEVGL